MRALIYPKATEAPPVDSFAYDPDPVEAEPLRGPRLPTSRLVIVGTIAAVPAALAILTIWLLRPPGEATLVEPPAAAIGGFAEMLVNTLLSQAGEGNEDVLTPYLGHAPDLSGVKPGSWYVANSATIDIEQAGLATWTVLVAVEQLGAVDGGYLPAGTAFYRVRVEDTPGGLRVRGLPAQVAPPSPPAPPVEASSAVGSGPLADAVTEVLEGVLTGSDARLDPSLAALALEPAPFESLQVRRITTTEEREGTLEATADIVAVDQVGRATPLADGVIVAVESP